MNSTAIRNTHPLVVTISRDNDGITTATDANDNVIVLDETLIQAEVTRLQAEYDSQEYARKRKQEYEQLNQWEMHFDDQLNGTTTWQDAILAIKQEIPK